jgi:hypothetical protein
VTGIASLSADDGAIALELPTITGEQMGERLAKTHTYTLMALKKTARYSRPETDAVVCEHGLCPPETGQSSQ